MKMFRSNSESNPNRISWTQIVNAIVQALIAALTALGVSSCTSAMFNVNQCTMLNVKC